MKLACGCGHTQFNALEEVQATNVVEIHKGPQGIEIEETAKGEFVREAATSVTVAYVCIKCDRVYTPAELANLQEV